MRVTSSFVFLYLLLVSNVTLGQYQINGNAAQTACNCWRLTTANNSQNGSVWNVNLFDLSNPFDFTFDVFLGCNDGGADGIAFVLQPLSVNAGSSGGGIGYAGISPSVAVELDNYQNGGEPGFDHMAIQTNGVVAHGGPNTLAGPVQISAASGNVEDCAWHVLNVVWDPGTNTLTVYFDGVLRLTYTGDIINNVFGGNPNVYWGFTSATGGANNLHQFCNALNPAFIIASPTQCVGFPVDFESASAVSTQIDSYDWDFGDGSTGSGAMVSHTFNTPGNYTVTLTITSEGCTESSTTQVTINPSPDASLGPDVAICDGGSIQISALNPMGGETYQWSPATGLDNATISNPTASPAATTVYTLTTTSAAGCMDSDDIEVAVNPLPVADAGPDQSICDGDATTMAASGGQTYLWNPATDLTDPTSATTAASPTTTTNYTVMVTDANGCQDMDDMTITVDPLPVVDAGADDSMCDEQTVQLLASGAATYSWSPSADLDNDAIANPVFSGSGTTTLTVTGTDGNGCINTDDVTVTVFPLPVADFANPADVCLGDPTNFTDNSTGTGLTYAWTFGDGSPVDANVDPTHTYAADGNYVVDLAITDANGCQDATSGSANVLELPVAAMNIADGAGFCENEVIQFMDESTGGASVVWDFGDFAWVPAIPNSTSAQSDPQFSYSTFGPYNVTLYTTSAAGCSDNTVTQIFIYDTPVADFSFDIACEGETTNFVDESSVLGGSTITGWDWDFGNGNGSSASQNPTYDYVIEGFYQVDLNVTTDNGCTDDVSKYVWVNPTPTIALSGIDTCLEDVTQFENNSSPQDNTIISWDWDFGDGTTATGVDQTHTYLDHGNYTVTLTATSDSGCVASNTTNIKVHPNPEPAFEAIEVEGCTPHEVLFVNQSTIATGFNATYLWDFGNGNSSTAASPTITYIDSGYYDITLSVTSTEGCNTEIFVQDAVRANITPKADFDMSDDVLSLLDATLELTDQSLHALTWDWTFGDGATSTDQNSNHRYTEPGFYDISLTVTNGDCEDTKYGQVKVEPIFSFYVPSAFTPDEDGINETFFGTGEGIEEYTMRIYNRWGEFLFESNNRDAHWDGTYLGKPVEAGLYVYRFYLIDWEGHDHKYNGHFNLLR